MRMVDLIEKKRDGNPLTREEIKFIIEGYVSGDIKDYHMSAWSMAVFFQGMNEEETAELTLAMAESGEQLDLSTLGNKFVDKHSTGGVGDKTTLVLAPMVAACGVPVAKMSGRGLGHTGGTIDKLSSISGLQLELERESFLSQVKKIGLAIMSQSGNLVPADKKLYALRDVTATVDSVPLIASSIMSKKIAAGAQGIVLDVKYGSGAFMKDLDAARTLATTMVRIGNSLDRRTIALLSDMEQPLGRAVGNSLEVMEAIDTLQGSGPSDLLEVCLELGAWMLVAGEKAPDAAAGKELLHKTLASGAAWEKFLEFVGAQGGDINAVKDKKLPLSSFRMPFLAAESGFVQKMDARTVGDVAMLLGAGRETKESGIDLGAGVFIRKKPGEWVEAGEALLDLYSNDEKKMAAGLNYAHKAVTLGVKPPKTMPLIAEVIR